MVQPHKYSYLSLGQLYRLQHKMSERKTVWGLKAEPTFCYKKGRFSLTYCWAALLIRCPQADSTLGWRVFPDSSGKCSVLWHNAWSKAAFPWGEITVSLAQPPDLVWAPNSLNPGLLLLCDDGRVIFCYRSRCKSSIHSCLPVVTWITSELKRETIPIIFVWSKEN